MKYILFVIFLMLTGCNKSEDRVKEYLKSGKELYAKGDFDKAKIEFKNVLQLDSKQSEAYYHIALIEEKNQNWQAVYGNLVQATRLNPKNTDAFLKLGRLNLLAGHPDDTLKNIEAILKITPDNPDALSLKGAVSIKNKDFDAAMAIANQVLEKHPDHIDSISLKTVAFMGKKDFASALSVVEKALQTKPGDMALLLLKLQVHTQSNDLAATEQDYIGLINQFPDNMDYSFALVKHYLEHNQTDKATSTLQALTEKNPTSIKPKLAIADIQARSNPELAEKTILSYLAQHPDEPELLFRVAAIYAKQNKLAETKEALNKIISVKSDAKECLAARVMLAKMAVQANDAETVAKFSKEILAIDKGNKDGLIFKAMLDLEKGAVDDAITGLRVILRDFSNSDEAMVLLGKAYLQKDSPELAEENFRKALDINPANFDALIPVASKLIKNKEIGRAEDLLQKALKMKPDHPMALQALAQVKLLQKDWVGTQKLADSIAVKENGAGYAKFLSGKISESQGLFKEAIGQYKEALAINPNIGDIIIGIVNCYKALGQNDAKYAFLDEQMKAHPDNSALWLLKSEQLAQDKRLDDAIKLLADGMTKWPKVAGFYEAAANAHLAKNDPDQAIGILGKGLENITDQPRLNIMLASVYEQTKAYDKALATYDAIIAKYPDLDIATNNLVSLLLDHFNTKENVERAVTLAKRFEKSDQPYFMDSYGWALLNAGKHDQALQTLINAAAKMPEVPVFKYHLGMAYYKNNNKVAAINELEQALKLGTQQGGFLEKEATEKLLQTVKSGS